MRLINVSVSATLLAIGVGGGVTAAPSAWAYDVSINGTYTATVVGDWARTNDVYHQERVVRSTWKVTSSCSTAEDCTGKVVSDQGWTAPMFMTDGSTWYVNRDIPDWETCPDGSKFPGHDVFHFYPADPETAEHVDGSSVLAGRNQTIGPSGACGTNKPLYIDQPFRLDKIG